MNVISNTDPFVSLAEMGLPLTPPKTEQELDELMQTLQHFQAAQFAQIEKLKLISQKQLACIAKKTEEEGAQAKQHLKLETDLKALKAEKQSEEAALARMKPVFTKMKDLFDCPVCHEVASLPKVLGICGHVACEGCVKKYDQEEYNKMKIAAVADMEVARIFTTTRRCPLCRTTMTGTGFPVDPLKEIVQLALQSGFLPSRDGEQDTKLKEYEKPTSKEEIAAAELTRVCAEKEIVHNIIDELLPDIAQEQWQKEVDLAFEHSLSKSFSDTVVEAIVDKIGSIKYKYELHSRMIRVKLDSQNPALEYPQGGYNSVKKARDKADDLILFSKAAKKSMDYIQGNIPKTITDLEGIQAASKNAENAHQAALKAQEFASDSTKTLDEINAALRKAIEAKSLYAQSYAKLPGCLLVSISLDKRFEYKFMWNEGGAQ